MCVRWRAVWSVLLAGSSLAIAQVSSGRGEIKGEVDDRSGAVVPGAAVRLRNVRTGEITNLHTGANGVFDARDLEPGPYSLEIKDRGFQKYVREHLELAADRLVEVNAVLELCHSLYLPQDNRGFTITVRRDADSETQRELIERVENYPCPGGRWTKDTGTGMRGVECVCREAVDYYTRLLNSYKKRVFPFHRRKLVSAHFVYVATARFDQDARRWKVTLRLEYDEYTGGTFGSESLWRTRTFTFDESLHLVTVSESDECDGGGGEVS